jgi:3-oxoacyl-(acyl-carrier-protein) synthase
MMKKSNYYINGVGIISPQKTFDNSEFLPEVLEYHNNMMTCTVPDFKEYINPVQLRRLSRMLRIGLSAGMIALRDSKDIAPHGIITATGHGFLNDTAKFLTEIYELHEKQLTPTFFMQSTYNALAGLVALTLKCKGYNNTYVNKGFALETALHDAMMQLNAVSTQTFLVGTYDETEEAQYKINSRAGYYKSTLINSLKLFEYPTDGTVMGEGAAFFSVSGKRGENAWCQLQDVKMVYRPESTEALQSELTQFLFSNAATVQDIDVLVSGVSGDVSKDQILREITRSEFGNIPEVRFKHLTGEYSTASSFALWLGASMLKKQQIPAVLKFNTAPGNSAIHTVLFINQYMGKNYTFVLLKALS